MKICIMQDTLPFQRPGGAQNMAWRTAKGLARRGHEVTLVTTSTARWRGRKNIDGILVHFLKEAKTAWGLEYFRNFVGVAFEEFFRNSARDFDILQVRGWITAGLTGLSCRSIPVPVPVVGHTAGIGFSNQFVTPCRLLLCDRSRNLPDSFRLILKTLKRYLRIYYPIERGVRFLDAFSTASKHALRLSRVLYPISQNRQFIVNDGIPLERFSPPETEPDKETVLFVGILTRLKGPDVLLRAAPIVLKRVPSAEFRLIGDGPLMAELKSLASRLGISQKVAFLGEKYEENVVTELKRCKVFVNPSQHTGGYESTQIEAMACGRIIITPDAGSNAMVVLPGKTGFMFRQGSAPSLGKTIVKALTLEDTVGKSIRSSARERAANHFSVETMGGMTEQLLMRIVETC